MTDLEELAQATTHRPSYRKRPQRSNSGNAVIIGSMVVIVACVLFVIVILSSPSDRTPTPTPTASKIVVPEPLVDRFSPRATGILRSISPDELKPYTHEGKVWRYDAIYQRQKVAFSLIRTVEGYEADGWIVAEMATDLTTRKHVRADDAASRFR